MNAKSVFLTWIVCLFIAITSLTAQKSPEAVFGFQMGTDRQLIDWQQIRDYFQMLGEQSPRVEVVELGETTLGRTMIMAIISSEATIRNLDKYKKIQEQLARPYDLAETDAQQLIEDGKTVCLITMNIHSNEIAASQESVELAHELATAQDKKTLTMLDNVILLMVPSLNPDGQDMITKWYRKNVGTKYEGSRMPHKYHFYADHDNNRDWFFFSLKESQHTAKVLYHEWYPEIVMDQHQMGATGARFFLPPYSDPVNPNVPPSLMANLNMAGKHMIADMHDQGFKGLVTNTIFNAFFEGTMSKTPLWHNRIGILTEAASVRYATPLFIPRTSLRGMGIDLPEYKQQTNFLDPWPGGWWRLRDIVEYQKAAALSLLHLASTHKEKFKTNFYRLNKRAIEVHTKGHPVSYVIPQNQHDPGNAIELMKRLRYGNVEIYQAEKDFVAEGHHFKAGDFVIPLAQPTRAYIKDLMEPQQYPNLQEYPGGPPRQPYDVTGWTLPLQMGVKAVPLSKPLTVPLKETEALQLKIDTLSIKPGWLAVDRNNTNSYRLVNAFHQEQIDIFQLTETYAGFPKGTFAVRCDDANQAQLKEKSLEFQVQFSTMDAEDERVQFPGVKIRSARIGVYQPWIPWIYDEGWLRLVLDEFDFKHQTLHNADIAGKSNLSSEFDVLIFGSQRSQSILNGVSGKEIPGEAVVRENYVGGLGSTGVNRLKKFIHSGGTVLFFGDACNFAIEQFDLPGENILKGTNRKDFFIPGSILEMNLDTDSPLTYGMPEKTPVYINNRLALKLYPYTAEIGEIGYYGDNRLLKSGWAVGEDKLYEKVGLAEIPLGKGKIILYAFRPQHRSQTYGTFKLIFNALYKQ